MSLPIIQVENLSKKFVIAHEAQEKYTSLRDVLTRRTKRIFSFSRPENKQVMKESFYALKDVSFNIQQGGRVGIIGRNGAGKSTLLKILSRITDPTEGRITVRGRVASLLEVGTGFHPELTGRENIFLNGAILGMSRADIRKRFDEIVDFAEVEKFLDTPVKRYSSGMYVRLAFAVAAHLEPQILIVDEVLAVGDAQFQKKCLGKMEDVSNKDGRTVLFVSHNIAAIKSLCTEGIVLQNGKVAFIGSQQDSINFYQNSYNTGSKIEHTDAIEKAPGNENIKIARFVVTPLKGDVVTISSGLNFQLFFYNHKENINLDVTFELISSDEVTIIHRGKIISDNRNSKKGMYQIEGSFPGNVLNAGIYRFRVIFGENQRHVLFATDDLIRFEVLNESHGSNSSVLPGILALDLPFTVKSVS